MENRDPNTGDDVVDRVTPRFGLRYAAVSDVGRVRKDNQDSAFASRHLLMVADGVGGAARGDVASSTAVQALRRLDAPPPADLLEALAGAIHRAHDRIAELVEQDPALEGTSTTVTACLFDGRRIGVAHVGDSRGYLLRDGVLSQLTRDHTFVQTLIDEGRITEVESRTHPHRNLILRAVDGVHETDPDLFFIELAPGDRLLLCSDGASGVLDQDRLTDILGTGSVDYAAVEVVRASLAAGTSDNVTCVVADVVEADAADAGGPVGGVTEAVPGAGPGAGPDRGTDTGAIVVGAAAEQLRRSGQSSKSLFRGHRGGDTGEIEPVPGEEQDTDDSADPEELRYAPRPPRRGRWLRALAGMLVLALVLGGAGWLAYRWTQSQFYVAEHTGRVAIFRGVQADIPGLTLTKVEEDTEITIDALPDYQTQQVAEGLQADSLSDARRIVDLLTEDARVCPQPRTGAPSPTASPTARPGSSATPEPSPSPTLAPPDCIEATS
jgi:protein phosphatase